MEMRKISGPCWGPKPGSSSPWPQYLISGKNLHEHYDNTHTAPKHNIYRNIYLNWYHNAFHFTHWIVSSSFFYFIFLTNLEHPPRSAIFPPLHLHVGTAGDSVLSTKKVSQSLFMLTSRHNQALAIFKKTDPMSVW